MRSRAAGFIIPPGVARITEVVHVRGATYLNVVMRDGTTRTIPARQA